MIMVSHMFSETSNIALGKEVEQSSVYESREYDAFRATDGCKSNTWEGGCCSHTGNDFNPWWRIDLGKMTAIKEIVITRRWDACKCSVSLIHKHVYVMYRNCSTFKNKVENKCFLICFQK